MCVLHIESETTSFAEFLKRSRLPVYQSHEKGDECFRRKQTFYEYYGFSCNVSDREWTDLTGQIKDAQAFLHKHESELRILISTHTVDDIRLDFPISRRLDEHIIVQCHYLPPALLKLAGELGIGIELSLYPPEESNDSE